MRLEHGLQLSISRGVRKIAYKQADLAYSISFHHRYMPRATWFNTYSVSLLLSITLKKLLKYQCVYCESVIHSNHIILCIHYK